MRLDKEEYKYAKRCLKRFNYNKLNILMRRTDLMSLSAVNIDGQPKGKNKISDIVGQTIVRIEEDKELNKSIKEYKAVLLAREMIDEDSKYILDHIYDMQDMNKWDIVYSEERPMSEITFKRKHSKLVYAVLEQLKNWYKIDTFL